MRMTRNSQKLGKRLKNWQKIQEPKEVYFKLLIHCPKYFRQNLCLPKVGGLSLETCVISRILSSQHPWWYVRDTNERFKFGIWVGVIWGRIENLTLKKAQKGDL